MVKVFLTMLLTAASTGAMAGWIKISSTDNTAFYADPDSIIKTGNKVKMRAMHDYKIAAKAADQAFLSTEVQEEYDCRKKLSRTLYFASYSRNLGKGRKVYLDADLHQWMPARPGSARESLWKFACMNQAPGKLPAPRE